jgi:hypothetical protein
MNRAHCLIALAVAVAGCSQPREPVPAPTPADATAAAVVRRPVPENAANAPAVAPTAAAPVYVPPDALYVCVSEAGGVRRQTAIEFSPKVGAMCAQHPEMGPCQYERNACRRGGGRVYAAGGVEVTPATEAEYDRKVMRVRLRTN